MSDQCPLYPQKQTLAGAIGMSAMWQKRTLAASFDHLVGELLEVQGHIEAECFGGPEVDH